MQQRGVLLSITQSTIRRRLRILATAAFIRATGPESIPVCLLDLIQSRKNRRDYSPRLIRLGSCIHCIPFSLRHDEPALPTLPGMGSCKPYIALAWLADLLSEQGRFLRNVHWR